MSEAKKGCYIVCMECLGNELVPLDKTRFYLPEYRPGPLMGTQWPQNVVAEIDKFVNAHNHTDGEDHDELDDDGFPWSPEFCEVTEGVFDGAPTERMRLVDTVREAGRSIWPFE